MGSSDEYMDAKYNVKSVITLVKWIKKEILNRNINVECDAVKADSNVYIFWAHNNTLHTHYNF